MLVASKSLDNGKVLRISCAGAKLSALCSLCLCWNGWSGTGCRRELLDEEWCVYGEDAKQRRSSNGNS